MAKIGRQFDISGQAFKRDPMPTFARMRAAGPVVPGRIPLVGEISLVTTHAGVSAVLKDPAGFTVESARAGRKRAAGLRWWMPRQFRLLTNNMLLKDDPEHRRLRRLVDAAFHRQSIAALRPRIATIADDLIDRLAASRDNDLVLHFARQLPLAVIGELLGLRREDRPRFIRWMRGITEARTPVDAVRVVYGVGRLVGYLENEFARRRRAPSGDLISALVEVRDEGERLNGEELLAMCFLLFVAGHETTTHLISGSVLALLQHSDELDKLRSDWSHAGTAVDELLRYVSPVQMTKPRYAVEDCLVDGVAVRRGQMLSALLASANCDEQAFDRPECLDLARTPNRHLAFGSGPHLCLGLALARAETEIALERLFTRRPALRLAVPEDALRWTRRVGMRALRRLPVAGIS